MGDSKQKLLNVYKTVETNLRKAGTHMFTDDNAGHANQKLASKYICTVLLQKMRDEMLQGRFLELKNDLIRSGVRQTEIVDPTIETLERLFSENGLHVYTYVANMMIILMRRVALGVEYVGKENAEKIIDLYPEVSKAGIYQKEFNNFQGAFKGVIDPGVSICDFIYINMHQYLSYHYRYQGPKQLGILMMAKYLKLRMQFKMYRKLENILVEILLLVVQALDYDLCMFKQARHLLSVVYSHIKRTEAGPNNVEHAENWKLLKQLCIINESLYLAVNLQKSYDNMVQKTSIGAFFDKYEKFKDDDVEEVDLPIRLARNQSELQQLCQKLCGFNNCFVDVPILSTIFDAIIASVQTMPFFITY